MHLFIFYLFLAVTAQENSIFWYFVDHVERRIVLDKYVLPKAKER